MQSEHSSRLRALVTMRKHIKSSFNRRYETWRPRRSDGFDRGGKRIQSADVVSDAEKLCGVARVALRGLGLTEEECQNLVTDVRRRYPTQFRAVNSGSEPVKSLPQHQRAMVLVQSICDDWYVEQCRVAAATTLQAHSRRFLARRTFLSKKARFIDSSLRERNRAFRELVRDERRYNEYLDVLVTQYLLPLRERKQKDAILKPDVISGIFGNIEAIRSVDGPVLLKLLEVQQNWPAVDDVGKAMCQMAPSLTVYESFVYNVHHSQNLLATEQSRNPRFAKFLADVYARTEDLGLGLFELLGLPLNVIGRYSQTVSVMAVHTPADALGADGIESAQIILADMQKTVQDAIQYSEMRGKILAIASKITGGDALRLTERQRQFLWEGTYSVGFKQIALGERKLKMSEHHLYVFNDLLIVTKVKAKKHKVKAMIDLYSASFRREPPDADWAGRVPSNSIFILVDEAEDLETATGTRERGPAGKERMRARKDRVEGGIWKVSGKMLGGKDPFEDELLQCEWICVSTTSPSGLEPLAVQFIEHSEIRQSGVCKVFGRPLSEVVAQNENFPHGKDERASNIPMVVSMCIEGLRSHVREEGLFRISGLKKEIDALQAQADEDVVSLNLLDASPHAVAGLFKLYLRALPEPLLTFEVYESILPLLQSSGDDLASLIPELRFRLRNLPAPNFAVLRLLCNFLSEVMEHSEVNKMTAHNLSVVFGPNLWRPREDTMENSLLVPKFNVLTKIMLEEYDAIFKKASSRGKKKRTRQRKEKTDNVDAAEPKGSKDEDEGVADADTAPGRPPPTRPVGNSLKLGGGSDDMPARTAPTRPRLPTRDHI